MNLMLGPIPIAELCHRCGALASVPRVVLDRGLYRGMCRMCISALVRAALRRIGHVRPLGGQGTKMRADL